MRAPTLAIVLVLGCSCGAPSEPATLPRSPTPTTEPETDPAYTVHEWGLVRAGANDTLIVGALGPSEPPAPADLMVVEKPVLYFHLTGARSFPLTTASVTAVQGEIREHWPLTTTASAMPTSVSWAPLTLETERCGVSVPISRAQPPCAALPADEACEALELARVVSDDASCVRTGDTAMPFLFYRSTSRGLTAPIQAFYLDFDDINVTHGGGPAIPGRMFRFQRVASGTRALVFDPPAPGETRVVGHDWIDVSDVRAALEETLTGLGLTHGEAAAFAASWDEAFFGRMPREHIVEEEMAEERTLAETPARPEDSVLYFLPPESVESISTLSFEPPPREIRRAIAVWTAL